MFLGIKGIYYEISIQSNGKDVPVRWLEGYEFQQHVPTDVDFRILLTFIELYRVLLGFTLFKLYTEENLVYPPPLDKELDERGESVGAFKLVQRNQAQAGQGSGVSKKEVKRVIKGIQAAAVGAAAGNDVDMDGDEDDETEIEAGPSTDNTEENEDFVERPSKDASDDVAQGPLTTFNTILSASSVPADSLLFAPYTFYISRETSTKTWEFVVRAMGGRCITSVQCPDLASKEADAITHVIIDRPVTEARKREMENERKWVWVQPQWVADCVNASRVLGAESYKPGALLPPHLSPWEGDGEQARPWLEKDAEAEANAADVDVDIAEEVEEEEDEEEDEDEDEDEDASTATPTYPPALLASASDPTNPTLLHAAELEAETNGVSSGAFKNQLKEATKMLRAEGKLAPAAAAGKKAKGETGEEDLRKIMMSNKKAKLYEKIKYSNKAKQDEVSDGVLFESRIGEPIVELMRDYRKIISSRSGSLSRSASVKRLARLVVRRQGAWDGYAWTTPHCWWTDVQGDGEAGRGGMMGFFSLYRHRTDLGYACTYSRTACISLVARCSTLNG